ncbi:MAG: hypothetical protein JO023_05900 [Chloroflexi bacterium]|nr:hypothetical protein [Chloroflexota bacterium]
MNEVAIGGRAHQLTMEIDGASLRPGPLPTRGIPARPSRRGTALQLSPRRFPDRAGGAGLEPQPYLFWALVGTPALLQAGQAGWWAAAAFLVGYYSTIVGSNVGLAVALHRWISLLSDRAYRGLLLLGSALLAVFGLLLLGRGVQGVQRR